MGVPGEFLGFRGFRGIPGEFLGNPGVPVGSGGVLGNSGDFGEVPGGSGWFRDGPGFYTPFCPTKHQFICLNSLFRWVCFLKE